MKIPRDTEDALGRNGCILHGPDHGRPARGSFMSAQGALGSPSLDEPDLILQVPHQWETAIWRQWTDPNRARRTPNRLVVSDSGVAGCTEDDCDLCPAPSVPVLI